MGELQPKCKVPLFDPPLTGSSFCFSSNCTLQTTFKGRSAPPDHGAEILESWAFDLENQRSGWLTTGHKSHKDYIYGPSIPPYKVTSVGILASPTVLGLAALNRWTFHCLFCNFLLKCRRKATRRNKRGKSTWTLLSFRQPQRCQGAVEGAGRRGGCLTTPALGSPSAWVTVFHGRATGLHPFAAILQLQWVSRKTQFITHVFLFSRNRICHSLLKIPWTGLSTVAAKRAHQDLCSCWTSVPPEDSHSLH